jgi:dTDP-4-dehydrorhamnose 3,5-epimerase
MTFTELDLPGVTLIEPALFGDARGFFVELYHRRKFSAAGIDVEFVQENHSRSAAGVLRGLHYQLRRPQAKLVRVVLGEIYDVAVDIRRNSPHFGRSTGVILSASNHQQIYIPAGFAHGFCVTADAAEVVYQCSDFYAPDDERGLLWSDPDLGIDWPVQQPILSERDRHNPRLRNVGIDLPE